MKTTTPAPRTTALLVRIFGSVCEAQNIIFCMVELRGSERRNLEGGTRETRGQAIEDGILEGSETNPGSYLSI